MANIVGGVTSINNPRTNWLQTDAKKADFLKNKPAVANALKGHKTGAIISADDVSPIEHELDVNKKSKNIIPYPYYSTALNPVFKQNGVTFTDNGDGSITIDTNGQPSTGGAIFYLQNKPHLDVGTYTISGGTPDVSVHARKNATSWIESGPYSYNTGTVKKDDVINMYGVLINSGKIINNVTIYPQLEKGTVTVSRPLQACA